MLDDDQLAIANQPGAGQATTTGTGKPTGANPLVIARAFYELFKLSRRIRRETSTPVSRRI